MDTQSKLDINMSADTGLIEVVENVISVTVFVYWPNAQQGRRLAKAHKQCRWQGAASRVKERASERKGKMPAVKFVPNTRSFRVTQAKRIRDIRADLFGEARTALSLIADNDINRCPRYLARDHHAIPLDAKILKF